MLWIKVNKELKMELVLGCFYFTQFLSVPFILGFDFSYFAVLFFVVLANMYMVFSKKIEVSKSQTNFVVP